jgi:hypothetical protein
MFIARVMYAEIGEAVTKQHTEEYQLHGAATTILAEIIEFRVGAGAKVRMTTYCQHPDVPAS